MLPLLPAAVTSLPDSSSLGEPPRGEHPVLGLESPILAASHSRPLRCPCVSVLSAHLWLLPRVPKLPSIVVQLIWPRWEQSPGTVPRKASGERRSIGVTSNPPALLGKLTVLMEACTNMGNKASIISSSSCAYEARASGGDNATVKGQGIVQDNGDQFPCGSKASAFQVGLAHSSHPVC